MQSGLDFEEAYDKTRSDVNRMLFEAADASGAAMRSPAAQAPGEAWYYSSGTSNILAWLYRGTLQRAEINDQAFADGPCNIALRCAADNWDLETQSDFFPAA